MSEFAASKNLRLVVMMMNQKKATRESWSCHITLLTLLRVVCVRALQIPAPARGGVQSLKESLPNTNVRTR